MIVYLLLFSIFTGGQLSNTVTRATPALPASQGPVTKNDAAEKWIPFWKTFSKAVSDKDRTTIIKLTSPEFYDGGGATVEQWLDAEVFANDKLFRQFKESLAKPVHNFKGFDGNPYKATGKNKTGDLFFQYKKGQWLFGGMVGD